MRHGTSAIALALGGVFSASIGLLVVGGIASTVTAGITGWDPVGVSDTCTPAAASTSRDCDTNYAGACLDSDAIDYDCEGGSGDGPEYTRLIQVVGLTSMTWTVAATGQAATNSDALSPVATRHQLGASRRPGASTNRR